jgi:hypothetical protein
VLVVGSDALNNLGQGVVAGGVLVTGTGFVAHKQFTHIQGIFYFFCWLFLFGIVELRHVDLVST